MTRPIAILRPAPGSDATASRVRDVGLDPLLVPLFKVVPLDWTPPDPAEFGALLLTSANAARYAGDGLTMLARLPVLAVGPQTGRAAEHAGLRVVECGSRGVAALLARQPMCQRVLWLSGRDRMTIEHPAIRAVIPVYANEGVDLTRDAAMRLPGSVALVHSARATRQLAAQLDAHGIARNCVRIAAISARAADADGRGWDRVAIAAEPNDTALIAAAHRLAIDP
ncbi:MULTISPECIES: uroporphyrinogen-III synthase [unclassified Sphingomonas]|uniref:uroporphyrinogen-III synthase n=1 Tax=unclassified Sphingomonas TaxID=196159 RepID=UPI0021519616|nr:MULTISPECIES: uroporphyrinogen-III synthase [unclassified Sphingomonas]MCR5870456.1 uroporphyrinogen-III synthase [Sphingomonas sp. J344]UUY01199.1 uroporphyrinogen-III synthase [Sphingomonas sp. J315]